MEIENQIEPVTVEEFVESIRIAEHEIDNVDCVSMGDFENTSKPWD